MVGWSKLPAGWRMALAMGLPYGLFMGLWGWWQFGSPVAGAMVALIGGVGFGLTMALLGGVAQVVSSSSGGTQAPTLGVRARGRLSVSSTPGEALRVARRILHEQGATEQQATADEVCVRTKATFWSWGEIVSVEAFADGPLTTVMVQSRPAMWTTLVDYGKNQANVDALVSALRTELAPAPVSAEERAAVEEVERLGQAAARSSVAQPQ
ncbi:MAG: hypothetical protein KTR31_24330 [Myxococcales bacterium]|nr:hypothetical protein [Myxococcales bacterium]